MKKFFLLFIIFIIAIIGIFFVADEKKAKEFINSLLQSKDKTKEYLITKKFFMFKHIAAARYANVLHSQKQGQDLKKFLIHLHKDKALYTLSPGSRFVVIDEVQGFYNINVTFKDGKKHKGWIFKKRASEFIEGKIEIKVPYKNKVDACVKSIFCRGCG